MQIFDENLLDRFRGWGRCEWCGRMKTCEPSHSFSKGIGGGSRLDIEENLTSLCHECHMRHHYSGHPTTLDLIKVTAQRLGKPWEVVQERLWELRRHSR